MVVNSEAVKEAALRQERPGPKRIEVITNGLDLSKYGPRAPALSRRSNARIGMLSMLRAEKRVDLFLKAAIEIRKTFREATFLIAGDGPERSQIESLIRQSGLESCVELLGAVDDVPGFPGRPRDLGQPGLDATKWGCRFVRH